jgi:betaine lipid synthase
VIPPFHSAVDAACSYLDPNGYMAVTDFYVSAKHDLPLRQMSWMRRFFWQATFDLDGIALGSERREYLEHKLTRVYEYNGEGGIPYVPLLRAPYFIWIGQKDTMFVHHTEARVEAPPLFPPTFLYSQSWEDPHPDIEVLKINAKDTVLTLTSGGCNALNLVIHGAKEVVAVDCNPAQSALLELKKESIKRLEYADTWELFGEGKHARVEEVYQRDLAPWMSQTSHNFWKDRMHYFKQGLYYQGGMGKVCWIAQWLFWFMGFSGVMQRFCNAESLEEQRRVWNGIWVVRFFKHAPAFLYEIVNTFIQVRAHPLYLYTSPTLCTSQSSALRRWCRTLLPSLP